MPVAGPVKARQGRAGLRLTAAGLAALLLAACGAGSGHPGTGTGGASGTPTAGKPTSNQTSGADVSAFSDLATVLVHPDGMGPLSHDQLSGPIASRDDVALLFSDVPGQVTRILRNGFVRGYIQNWGSSPPTPSSSLMPPSVTATMIVLEFKSDDGAAATAKMFRRDVLSLGYSPFPVPSRLSHGYGVSQEQRLTSFTTYYQGVAWTRRARLYSVALQSPARPTGTDGVIALALRQDSAAAHP